MKLRSLLKRMKEIGIKESVKKLIGFEEVYAIIFRKTMEEENPVYNSMKYKYACIPHSDEYWYADPMLFCYNGQLYLFMEAFEYASQKGRIAYSILKKDNSFSTPEIIIEESFHMSFPIVFKLDDEIYMLPETSENLTLNLYRCLDFPIKWECYCSIPTEGPMVDSIFLNKDFAFGKILTSLSNIHEPLKTKYQCYDFQIKNLKLESDEKFNSEQDFSYDTRNAGGLFERGGKQLHPVQVSTSKDYGVSLKIFEYHDLKNGKLDEKLIGSIDINNIDVEGIPKRKMIGVHTYCFLNGMEIMDLRYMKFRIRKWVDRIKKGKSV